MNVIVNGRLFSASYFPFFRTYRGPDFDEWGIRLADGSISDVSVLVFDHTKTMAELYENARWLINEYVLEEDDMLTVDAQKIKKSLSEIFGEQRR
jgi:hypothetical protein